MSHATSLHNSATYFLLTYLFLARRSSEAGEFAANLYLSTAPGQGSLSIYPVQQLAQMGVPQPTALASRG